MTRLEALKELAAKVEAGTWDEVSEAFPLPALTFPNFGRAYHGSLDAAKALHDALLPASWIVFSIDQDSARRWYVTLSDTTGRAGTIPHTGHRSNPARAWILAILRALIAQEESE
ncbi:hypothetical protein PXK01_19635 [Phaeobacter sp. PT47_59]|uniref:hypothetical protein n=1 Tax=Phaeobacter sp. PT47_59 TaxID=3029979 RepID=UPI00237FE83A|nr:hypothetical protein [Phaeobacter sp. PT47_59]MDE4176374.1 hypothetical protein [Phaeobacter sp. PT47_59]